MKKLNHCLEEFFNIQEGMGKDYVEIRFLKTQHGLVSGIFKTDEAGAKALTSEVQRLNIDKVSMYHTINKLSKDYVEKYLIEYKINTLYTRVKSTTKNADISELKLIMVDFDPIREAGVSATDQEKAKAKELMDKVVSDLSSEGLGKPAYITDSGNGFNAYYPVAFANDKKHNQIVADFIGAVSKKYSNEFVDIDLTTKNPSRIAKVPGSWSNKGENTSERPHRQCQLIESNVSQITLTAEQINSFIQVHSPKKKTKSGSKNTSSGGSLVAKIADVDAWLDNYDISYNKKECDYNGEKATMYVLEECQFTKHDNNNCSFIIKYSDGNCFYKCHHDHCNFTIHDFLKKYPVVNQIQLVCGEGDIVDIYNQVASGIELIKSDDNKRYVLRKDTNQILSYDNTDFDNYITEKAQELGKIISNNNVTTIKSNFRGAYENLST